MCVVSKNEAKEIASLATVNLSLFDYRGFMKSGRLQVTLWPPSEDPLFPLFAVRSNPNRDSACLLSELLSFDRLFIFAPIRDIYANAAHDIKQERTIDSEIIQILIIQPFKMTILACQIFLSVWEIVILIIRV